MSQHMSLVERVLSKADELIVIQEHGKAMSAPLDLIKKEIDMNSDKKNCVAHEDLTPCMCSWVAVKSE